MSWVSGGIGSIGGGGGGAGDIESVTAGNGLTGGGTSGAVTLNVAVSAGLTANANEVTLDTDLQAIAALTSAADKVPYFTGSGTAALADFTAAGRALVDDASAAAQRTTLGLGDTDSPLFKVLVEANTAVAASPNLLAATETRTLLTNEGIAAQNYHTLPTAAAGLVFEFFLQDADGIRIVANTGDTIRVLSLVSPAAGYVESTTIGSGIRLVALNATEWVATPAPIGTWTVSV